VTNVQKYEISDGFLIFAKRECETCSMAFPVFQELRSRVPVVGIYIQDEPDAFSSLEGQDDTSLEQSFRHDIETVPTLIQVSGGREVDRVVGWDRQGWQRVSGIEGLGAGLPAFRPGCGSKSREPGIHEQLRARYGQTGIRARAIETSEWDDAEEACFERGWTDGLPVVPPTDARILRMLEGTRRRPEEIVGKVPPNLADCTVEKVAINAVMAGCKPEYLPVVLAALEAALEPVFTMHGLLCTTCFSGPVICMPCRIRRMR
jgi:hypothetical protein